MGKGDLSDFEGVLAVGECADSADTSSEQRFKGENFLVEAEVQKRMGRLL